MAARLREKYSKEIKGQLQKELGIENVMAVPRLEKIVINMGVGRATQQASLIEPLPLEHLVGVDLVCARHLRYRRAWLQRCLHDQPLPLHAEPLATNPPPTSCLQLPCRIRHLHMLLLTRPHVHAASSGRLPHTDTRTFTCFYVQCGCSIADLNR